MFGMMKKNGTLFVFSKVGFGLCGVNLYALWFACSTNNNVIIQIKHYYYWRSVIIEVYLYLILFLINTSNVSIKAQFVFKHYTISCVI